jgi:hypothetical protein
MSILPPWAYGPFELIVHAERHLRDGDDFDRRIALISFDDAIEVSITTYLSLHPLQRGNRAYVKVDVDRWLQNYHTKLDFLDEELTQRGMGWAVDRGYILWGHDHRNEQYHGGRKGTPEKQVLELTRQAALWIFAVLFEVAEVEKELEEAYASLSTPPPPQHEGRFDRAIDAEYGILELAGQQYYVSEVLFSVDYTAYQETGQRLCAFQEVTNPEAPE